MPPISDSRFTIHDSAPAGARMTHPDEVDLLMRDSRVAVFEAGGCAPASSERHSGSATSTVASANPVAQLRMPRGCAPLANDITIGEWRTGSTGKSRTSPAKRSFWLEECCCGHRRGFHREGGLMCTVRGCACAGFITWAEADASRLEEWLTDDSAPRRLMWPFGEASDSRFTIHDSRFGASGRGIEAQQPGDAHSLPGVTSPSAAATHRLPIADWRLPIERLRARFEALTRHVFLWRGRAGDAAGRDGRGAPAASRPDPTEHENWGAE